MAPEAAQEASVEPVVPTPAPPAVVDAAAQDAAMAETTVAQAPPAPEVATPARAQEPVADAGTTEALHCAATLAQGGDPDEAVALLRNECAGAPAHLLADVHHKVLEACLRQDKVDTACELVTELLRSGPQGAVLPTSQEIVLRALVQGQQHGRAVELLRLACGAGAPPPGDAAFNGVVDAAVRARAYGEAWDTLELLLTHGRRADKYFVSILTKSLEASTDRRCVRRGIALVDRFIEQQREDVDEIVFNSLLNVLGHVSDMQKLQQTLHKMTEYGVLPSAVTYGTVVKAYGRARDIEMVLKVWDEMRGRCLGVNPVTCGCLLDACVKCGHLDKAMHIFQEMRLQGLHKNTVLYATLIKGLAKARDLASAVQLYQEMRHERVPCNLVTFNSLMDVCVRCEDLQTAALFLQDMMQMGIEPDLITFSTLIKGYSHTGEVHKAMALSRELKSRGLKCDEIMYNSLIDGCAKAGKLEEGLSVFSDMLQSRVPPSNITFSILVKLRFEAGQVNEAFRTVEEMSGKYRCAPSRIAYTVLLRCCATHGGVALARGAALLGELASKRNSKLPDQGMVGAIITGCANHRDFETASSLVRDFTAAGGTRRSSNLVHLDCLKVLFEAMGAAGDPQAAELLEYLRRRSLPAAHVSQLQAALADGRHREPAAAAFAGGSTQPVPMPQSAPAGAVQTAPSPAAGVGYAALGGFPAGMPPVGFGSPGTAMPMHPMAMTPQPLPTGHGGQALPSALDQYYYTPQQPGAFPHAAPLSPYAPAPPPDYYQAYHSPYQHLGYPYGTVLPPPALPQQQQQQQFQPLLQQQLQQQQHAQASVLTPEAALSESDPRLHQRQLLSVPPPPRTWSQADNKASDENAAPAPPKTNRAKAGQENQSANRGAAQKLAPQKPAQKQRQTAPRDQTNSMNAVAALNPRAQYGA